MIKKRRYTLANSTSISKIASISLVRLTPGTRKPITVVIRFLYASITLLLDKYSVAKNQEGCIIRKILRLGFFGLVETNNSKSWEDSMRLSRISLSRIETSLVGWEEDTAGFFFSMGQPPYSLAIAFNR